MRKASPKSGKACWLSLWLSTRMQWPHCHANAGAEIFGYGSDRGRPLSTRGATAVPVGVRVMFPGVMRGLRGCSTCPAARVHDAACCAPQKYLPA